MAKEELFEAVKEAVSGDDRYKEEREKILDLFHQFKDGNSSKRVLEYIGL